MPKVSIIIPVYNVEKYLKRCLDSVINQKLKDIEIICINDCSTDNSLKILQEYASKDKRIKLISLSENKGAGEAKNKGLEIAKGEYLSFIDPDDKIDLNFYEELYKKANETNADIVKCELITIETDGTKKKSCLNNLISTKSKFYFSYEYTSAIYKTSLIKDNHITFPSELIVGEDVVFLHKSIIKAKIIEVIDTTTYYYFRRYNSLNTQIYDTKRMQSAIKTIEYIADNYNNSLYNELSEEEYLKRYLANILSLLEYFQVKTDIFEQKLNCVKKFLELYNKCLLKQKLDNYMFTQFEKLKNIIMNNDAKTLVEICRKYKNIKNYCLLEKLKDNVKKDMKHAKNICNNTCV